MRRWPPTRGDHWIVALSGAVIGYVVGWFAVTTVCLMFAATHDMVPFPSPASAVMRAAMVAFAAAGMVIGFVWARRNRRGVGEAPDTRACATWAMGSVLVLVVPAFLFGLLGDQTFVSSLPSSVPDKHLALVRGRAACHDLAAQDWDRSYGMPRAAWLAGVRRWELNRKERDQVWEAWRSLCPFTQWAHTRIGNMGDAPGGGGGD